MTPPFRVEVLGPDHVRDGFDSGVSALDLYLNRQAGQDARRRVSTCFVAVDTASGRLAGYYTLAAGGIPLTDLPESMAKGLPRYPSVPVARLGRLAVDVAYQGRKLGGALLADAALRALRSELAAFALVVDAKDEGAAAFYRHHGFESFGGRSMQMVVPLRRFASARD